MEKRVQISTVIDPEIKRVLMHMCADDLISVRKLLERLITQEYARRNAPHHKLVDAPVGYHDVEEFYRDEERV